MFWLNNQIKCLLIKLKHSLKFYKMRFNLNQKPNLKYVHQFKTTDDHKKKRKTIRLMGLCLRTILRRNTNPK